MLKSKTVRRRLRVLLEKRNDECNRHKFALNNIDTEIRELRSRCPHENVNTFYCIYESPSTICDDCGYETKV